MNNGKMIFVTGSAMSGKSRFGVSQFKPEKSLYTQK